MKPTRFAFTLVELLVVIVIIALLILLAIPAIALIRQHALGVRCVSNLQQLHRAALVYAGDNGALPYAASSEYFDDTESRWKLQRTGWVDWFNYPADPRTYWWGNRGTACITNGTLFASAGRDPRIYLCPSFAKEKICGRKDAVRSYVMNSQVSGGSITMRGARRTILFADAGLHRYLEQGGGAPQVAWVGLRGWNADWDNYSGTALTRGGNASRQHYIHLDGELRGRIQESPPYSDEAVGSYHRGCGHAVFVDGHVDKLHYTNTVDACAGNWGEP